tara:strand:- start:407 stop:586 length:180 start_codon:yes stop_codon:yes gene_type:complete
MQFVKKTSSRKSIFGIMIKLSLVFLVVLAVIFLLNQIDFPTPNKEIEKIINNENFKIVK